LSATRSFRFGTHLGRPLLCLFLCLSASAYGAGRNWWPQAVSQPGALRQSNNPVPWPTVWALQQTGAMNVVLNTFGEFGAGITVGRHSYPWWQQVSFEAPPGSGFKYLYSASFWVGGIMGADTFVTQGGDAMDSWGRLSPELIPAGYGLTGLGSIYPCEGLADSSLRAEMVDTGRAGLYDNIYAEEGYHHPLHLKVIDRSCLWTTYPANHCILHDLIITNIGSQTIHSGFVAAMCDPDVRSPDTVTSKITDDFSGSLPESGTVYGIDNDGDPVQGDFSEDISPTKAIGFKFLTSSFPVFSKSYNWWSGYGYSDFGPRYRTHLREFMYTRKSSPSTDAERYYLMSNGEWDYDQPEVARIGASDTLWETPNQYEIADVCYGSDVRLLLSIGPFELPPDSSLRVLFATFIADSVQHDPRVMDFLPRAPELYFQNLNRESITQISRVADSLGAILTSPNAPITGSKVLVTTADSLLLAWDPWVLNNTDGYDLFATEIPDSAYIVRGVIPPWFVPSSPLLHAHLGKINETWLKDLAPSTAYAVQIANRVGENSGTPSQPLLVKRGLPISPQVRDTVAIVGDDNTMTLRWTQPPGFPVKQFNIYKFPDTVAARLRHLRFFSQYHQAYEPKQSYLVDGKRYYYYEPEVYHTLPAESLNFTDTAQSGEMFYVTAVDSGGFESELSHQVMVLDGRRTSDVLIMTNAMPSVNFVRFDSVRAFYDTVLSGRSHDFYSFVDSTQGNACPEAGTECLHVNDLSHYKLVIIDDGLGDGVLLARYDKGSGAFSRYLETGGRIAYFGSFTNMRSDPLDLSDPPSIVDPGNLFVRRYFGIDSLFYVGMTYYSDIGMPAHDTLFGFVEAEGVKPAFPSVSFDSSDSPIMPSIRLFWPPGAPPIVSTFVPNARGRATHRYRSQFPSTSLNEGQTVGVYTQSNTWQTFAFGFHLWYMDPSAARQLVNWMMSDVPTSVRPSTIANLPGTCALDQNFPNPFNPTTTIPFSLPTMEAVRLDIYNVLGQKIRSLVDESRPAGSYRVIWDGRDERGRLMSTGVYFARLLAAGHVKCRKMLLLK
jgi:hypothetical protein